MWRILYARKCLPSICRPNDPAGLKSKCFATKQFRQLNAGFSSVSRDSKVPEALQSKPVFYKQEGVINSQEMPVKSVVRDLLAKVLVIEHPQDLVHIAVSQGGKEINIMTAEIPETSVENTLDLKDNRESRGKLLDCCVFVHFSSFLRYFLF